ncbi:hypothetical protein CR513_55456, partial [Mucuna pruriens]
MYFFNFLGIPIGENPRKLSTWQSEEASCILERQQLFLAVIIVMVNFVLKVDRTLKRRTKRRYEKTSRATGLHAKTDTPKGPKKDVTLEPRVHVLHILSKSLHHINPLLNFSSIYHFH